MTQFNPDEYISVNERVQLFWQKYPEGRIETEIVQMDDAEVKNRMVVVIARVYNNLSSLLPIASGLAKEREGLGGANKTAFLENCETSAIGRALANLGMLTEKRPSREEMTSVNSITTEHKKHLDEILNIGKNADVETQELIKSLWSEAKRDPVVAAGLLTDLTATD